MSNPQKTTESLLYLFVVGMQYRFKGERALNEALQSFKVGQRVQLKPEPKNAHDPNAIAVFFRSKRIGYLPKEEATDLKNVDLSKYQFFFFDFEALASGHIDVSTTEVIGIPKGQGELSYVRDLMTMEFIDYKVHLTRKRSFFCVGDQTQVSLHKEGGCQTFIGNLELRNHHPLLQEHFRQQGISSYNFYMYELRNFQDAADLKRVRLRVIALRR